MFQSLPGRRRGERETFTCSILLATPLSPFKELQWPSEDDKWDSTMGAGAKKRHSEFFILRQISFEIFLSTPILYAISVT